MLAGGSGTRFWPLSTPENPKQLLPLSGSTSTCGRSDRAAGRAHSAGTGPRRGGAPAGRPGWNNGSNFPSLNLLVEPRAASTAPALIWATWRPAAGSRRGGAVAPRRLGVGDAAAFRRTAEMALATARRYDRWYRRVVPSRPETGYGYIVPARRSTRSPHGSAVFRKARRGHGARPHGGGSPLEQRALRLDRRRLLAETEAHTPEVAPCCPRSTRATSGGSSRASHRFRSTWACWSGAAAVAVVSGRLRLGRRGDLASADPGSSQGSQRERGGRCCVHAQRRGFHRLEPIGTPWCSAGFRI